MLKLSFTIALVACMLVSCSKKEQSETPKEAPIMLNVKAEEPPTTPIVPEKPEEVDSVPEDTSTAKETPTIVEKGVQKSIDGPAVQEITSSKMFDKQLTTYKEQLIIVDMYADWCNPSKKLAPIITNLGAKHKGNTVFLKVNAENFPDIAKTYDIRGYPVTLFIKNGVVASKISGLDTESAYDKKIAALK